jgi:hypothetical protein
MKNLRGVVLSLVFAMCPAVGYSQPVCVVPDLSAKQVKDIIDKARATRSDLPAPLADYKWNVTRKGCHYVYVETGLPEAPDYRNVLTLNQHGAIVDADHSNLTCPEKILSESELAEIVRKARATRRDLPPPFANFTTYVDRRRCLYLYFEYAVPAQRGNFQLFTIDPFGELMEFSRGRPY